MRVVFTKVSDLVHRVRVEREDGSVDQVELDSRSFLNHDFAHWVVEAELGLSGGVWGSVAAGGSLAGEGLDGADMVLAETLAGPMQTMFRLRADVDGIRSVLERDAPELATGAVAQRFHDRMRSLRGHWAATRYGADMELTWPPEPAG